MSKLSGLKRDWESLAQRDALSAILTDESKSGGKWDFHSKYIISTAQNVLEPAVSGVLSTNITSTEERSSSRRE